MNFHPKPLLLLVAFLARAGTVIAGNDLDEVVGTINGTPIRESQVVSEADRRINIYAAASTAKGLIYDESSRDNTRAAMREEALHALTERQLTTAQLVKDGIEITDGEVEAAFLAKMRERGQTLAEAEREIAEQGKTLRDVKERIRWNYLAIDRLYAVHSRDQARMTEDEALRIYRANPEAYRQEHERRVSRILIIASPDHDEEFKKAAKVRAEALWNRIKGGEDFSEVASSMSEDRLTAARGGDRGWSPRGFVTAPGNDPFGDAAFAMKSVGEVSDIVVTLDGYEIIKLTGVKEERQKSFDEVKAQIISTDHYQRVERFWIKFAAGLREKAEIVWSPEEIARKEEWQRKMAAGRGGATSIR